MCAMASESKQSVPAEDALPIQKTSPTAKIAAAVGVAIIAGLVVFAVSGGEDEEETVAAANKSADAQTGMTKAELEERQAHLKKTQAALLAAAADEAEEDKKAKPAAQPQQNPSPSQPTAQRPAPKPAKKPVNTKKSIDSLDALGADIASALK